MPVTVNLRHFDEGPVELEGELSAKDMDLEDFEDELVAVSEPLKYEVAVEKNETHLHVSGALELAVDATCKRCLKEFKLPIRLEPYHAYVPLEGEDAAPVANDLVDLTPFFREDMLLAFPQYPLCSENCTGLANALGSKTASPGKSPPGHETGSAWSELDKLKLK
jgi:uncharacterized metal-binding protein YceD (DUF177 family)